MGSRLEYCVKYATYSHDTVRQFASTKNCDLLVRRYTTSRRDALISHTIAGASKAGYRANGWREAWVLRQMAGARLSITPNGWCEA
jgi:hypothetical protein